MVHNVPESVKQSLNQRIEDDKETVKNILAPMADVSDLK